MVQYGSRYSWCAAETGNVFGFVSKFAHDSGTFEANLFVLVSMTVCVRGERVTINARFMCKKKARVKLTSGGTNIG